MQEIQKIEDILNAMVESQLKPAREMLALATAGYDIAQKNLEAVTKKMEAAQKKVDEIEKLKRTVLRILPKIVAKEEAAGERRTAALQKRR